MAPGYVLDIAGAGALGLSGAADGSLVVSQAPCYVAGTAVATPGGERRVEDLRAGDLVSLATGGTAPVAWVGHRRVRNADPVRVVAGAFGPGLPARRPGGLAGARPVPRRAPRSAHVLVDGTS